MAGRYLLGKGALKGDEDEVMPQQSRRAQEAAAALKSKKAKAKKKAKKAKKVAKKPVAKTVSSSKRGRKAKGRKWGGG